MNYKKHIAFLVLVCACLCYMAESADFHLISNSFRGVIPLYDSVDMQNVNVVLEAGELVRVKDYFDNYVLIFTIEGSAGWARISREKFDEIFKPVNEPRLRAHYTDEVDKPFPGVAPYSRDMPSPKQVLTDIREVSPLKVVVSLKGLTVRAIVEKDGLERVYPAGVGVKNRHGRSITPTNESRGMSFFNFWHDVSDSWYYMSRRWYPEYFGGFPFIRMNIANHSGHHTYGMHGPITQRPDGEWYLERGYVSSGCIRMQGGDAIELYRLAVRYPGARVYIIEDYDYNERGEIVDVNFPLLQNNAFITASVANIRSGPSTSEQILARLKRNTAVKIIEKLGDWYEIEIPGTGQRGYVFSELISH